MLVVENVTMVFDRVTNAKRVHEHENEYLLGLSAIAKYEQQLIDSQLFN